MNFLYFVILFPFLGFIILIFSSKFFPRYIISSIGVGSIGLSACIATFVMFDFLNSVNIDNYPLCFYQTIFTWISGSNFFIPVVLRLDGLSLSMLLLVTWVSFIIHMYASWYMSNNYSYSLFFAYMNLFVANMIILILADNLLLMYFGWEGVGLCSYLLIGFYHHHDGKNEELALKSFVMTRIGDIFLICVMFMLYNCFHTLNFHELSLFVSAESYVISPNLIALFLLVASVAKSAQFPFQTWLSDAMVAPTPVSALIHAATMVTAGVYLIARTYNIFVIAPGVLYLVGIVGAITLIMSSFSALVQNDIKKILAYSTIGQISYMFIALSVQAWESAIFHLIIHAFFKALLFLSSGSLILSCRGEQNIFKMGELMKSNFLVYFSFIVGSASLSALPVITSGFYSKGEILWNVLLSNNYLLVFSGLLGSLLTSLYTFRMIFVVFHTRLYIVFSDSFNNFLHYFPLLILSILSTFFGIFLKMSMYGSLPIMFIDNVNNNYFFKVIFEVCLSIIVLFGCVLSVMYYLFSCRVFLDKLLNYRIVKFFLECFFIGWGFDWIYKQIFVKPYIYIARVLFADPMNFLQYFIVNMVYFFSSRLLLIENGQLRYYITSLLFGVTIILLILISL